jgi:hypothetical protein
LSRCPCYRLPINGRSLCMANGLMPRVRRNHHPSSFSVVQQMEVIPSVPSTPQNHNEIKARGCMNLEGKIISLVYAVLLIGCAFFAAFDTFAFAFAIGDGGGHVSLAAGTLLIGTLAGGVGLVIAALGSWIRRPGISLIALVSALMVLPAAVLYGWQSFRAFWINTKHGMHYGCGAWASAILPPFLGLAAAGLSWARFRRVSSLFKSAIRDNVR